MNTRKTHGEKSAVRRLGAWLAMLALAVQALVVEPHVDLAYAAAPQISASSAATLTAPDGSPARACFICRQLALAGAVTLATPAALTLVSSTILDDAPALIAAAPFLFAAHPWQSRGPPQH